MIALLAATIEETALIRQSLEGKTESYAAGITLTTGQLCGHDVCLTHGGIGKAAAAAACITLLHSCRPQAPWLFGCGGAYPGSSLRIGDLALAECEIFGDEGIDTIEGFQDLAATGLIMRHSPGPFFNTWPVDQELYRWAKRCLAEHAASARKTLRCGPFVTVSTCTGSEAKAAQIAFRTGGICENMEGAAAALACQQMSVPFLEVRGISNMVEDRDTSRWDLAAGMTAAQAAILAMLQAWPGERT
ncbi:MAG: futalosine hydrolase [Desulfuromonadales bacterium]